MLRRSVSRAVLLLGHLHQPYADVAAFDLGGLALDGVFAYVAHRATIACVLGVVGPIADEVITGRI